MFRIFDKLGGQAEALKLLEPTALRPTWPSKDTIKVWRRRRALPGVVIARLMEVADERGVAYTAADFGEFSDPERQPADDAPPPSAPARPPDAVWSPADIYSET